MADLFLVKDRTGDAAVREEALRTNQSWIVEAPAGSGKTGLLIQRYLKLLTTPNVERPEQVLAITFTEKATAEMRERVLWHLEEAAKGSEVHSEFDSATRVLADAALRKDEGLGWRLLEHPSRLNIRTMHSVCAEITASLPVLSESGGRWKPTADAGGLYAEAARRTAMQLGGEDRKLDEALRLLLLHRDGNLSDVERLLAGMLEQRDQWGEFLSLTGPQLEDSYLDGTVRPRLERALEIAICNVLGRVADEMPIDVLQRLTKMAADMAHFDGYNGDASPIAVCAGKYANPGQPIEHLEHWKALAHLLVVSNQEAWRKGFNKNHVFFETDQITRAQMKSLVDELEGRDDLLKLVLSIGRLPPAKYPEDQWAVIKALFHVLRRALAELQLIFAERGECDFAELELTAKSVLRGNAGMNDYAETLGMRLEHLLVDEMQDTSSGQYELIELLTQGWDGQSQTVFLVGDPKQSIYLFRQARVERFLRTMRTGQLGQLMVNRLQLTANFRTQSTLVEGFNEDFLQVFPEGNHSGADAVTYTAVQAIRPANGPGREWHGSVLQYFPEAEDRKLPQQKLRKKAAEDIRRIIEEWRRKPLPEDRTKPWTVAVLVRAREHLSEIVEVLKEVRSGAAIPYRAIEIEALKDKQIVLDLVAITRALLHSADRVAWLAVLHAPWCGLGLADLHALVDGDNPESAKRGIQALIAERKHLLSVEGSERVGRVWPVLEAAQRQRGRLTTAQWVERTWRSLGGDLYATDNDLRDARQYLRLLDGIEAENGGVDREVLTRRLARLYAEAVASEGAVDLMTIHGAKGLEWDVVIVPALERFPPPARRGLLSWAELDSSEEDAAHVGLAPIEAKGGESEKLRDWIASIHKERYAAERKRLFYVACTRAREALHLFAIRGTKSNGSEDVDARSLLGVAWPAAEKHFAKLDLREEQSAEPREIKDQMLTMAASGEEVMEQARARPPILQRVPLAFNPAERFANIPRLAIAAREEAARDTPFERPEGSFAARVFGNAVHGFLEVLAKRIEAGVPGEELLGEIEGWGPRVEAVLRSGGLAAATVKADMPRVLSALRNTLRDETGRWLLRARERAASEYAFVSGEESGRSFRLDRMFVAGPEPLKEGDDCLWIVDYKTASHGLGLWVDAFLEEERVKYAPQMEIYARAMQTEAKELRLGLYYPLLPRLVWWKPEGL